MSENVYITFMDILEKITGEPGETIALNNAPSVVRVYLHCVFFILGIV